MKFTMLAAAMLTGLLALASVARAQDKPAAPPAPKPADPPKQESKEAGSVYVLMKTTAGDIVLELNRDKAPVSVDNFLKYADKGFYEGTVFHRVIPNFMIQGGGYTADMQLKDTEKGIKNEWENGLKNTRGTVAMARLGGQPDSGTSQFFINVRDNPGLDKPQSDGAAYAVFGKVVDGMDVVDKIRNGETRENPKMRNEKSLPTAPVKIEKVSRMTADEVTKLKEKTEKKGG
jgi:peptidyl-prolyl cis-trans isomerase A (cyclophilin A)